MRRDVPHKQEYRSKQRAIAEAVEKAGEHEKAIQIVKNMLTMRLDTELFVKITDLSANELEALNQSNR